MRSNAAKPTMPASYLEQEELLDWFHSLLAVGGVETCCAVDNEGSWNCWSEAAADLLQRSISSLTVWRTAANKSLSAACWLASG